MVVMTWSCGVTESEKRELQMMLFKTMIAPAVICLTLSAATTLHAQERMRAGNWENTVILANGQTMTQNACLSAHDAAMSNGSPAVIREIQIQSSLMPAVGGPPCPTTTGVSSLRKLQKSKTLKN